MKEVRTELVRYIDKMDEYTLRLMLGFIKALCADDKAEVRDEAC
jgi:hypothetical protein